MSEMKHQFHVGDWVDLKASTSLAGLSSHLQKLLVDAYKNNPHRVYDVLLSGNVRIEAQGLEKYAFSPGWFCLAAATTTTPIDDLI